MATVAAAITPLDIRALLLKGAVCSAMTRQGLRARDPRWEWDGEYPDPVLRITSIVVGWRSVVIEAERLDACAYDELIPEGVACVADCQVTSQHRAELERDVDEDCDTACWWDVAAFDAFGLGRFGDIVLADESRNIVSVEEGAW